MATLRGFVREWKNSESRFKSAHPGPFLLVLQTTKSASEEEGSFSTVRISKSHMVRSDPLDLPVHEVSKRPDGNAFAMMITVGRANNNDVVLDSESVSKFHAYFHEQGGTWNIQDYDSSNGTHLGFAKLEAKISAPIADKNEIKFAKVRCQFLLAESMYALLAKEAARA